MELSSDREPRTCYLWFLFKKDLSYFDSGKIDVMKMIFHMLFLVLETSKRRKLNKVPALSMNSFTLEVWCGV